MPSFTSKEFFHLLKFRSYTDIDFDASTRCDIVHDLNIELSAEHFDRYDFVFENGTLEHIFDVKTAVGNIARCVRTGGHVCHISPLTAIESDLGTRFAGRAASPAIARNVVGLNEDENAGSKPVKFAKSPDREPNFISS